MIYKIQIYFKHITEFTVLFNCIFFYQQIFIVQQLSCGGL